MITPYLNITLPDVLSTSGSTYASEINNAFLVFDQLLGSGFTPSSLNINSPLDFQGQDAINVRTIRYVNTGSLNAPTDVGCAYEFAGNLWYNDSAGNQIQLTSNGNLNTGINGNIGGLTGTSASVSFNSVSNAYSFYASPTRLATLNASTGVFSTVYVSGTLFAAQASFTSAAYGSIQNLTGSLVQATTVSGGVGNFGTLNATNGTINTLTAINGTITTLSNTTLNGINATLTQLTSSGGKIASISASQVSVSALTASTVNATSQITTPSVSTTSLTSNAATITNLTSSGANLGPVQATTINGTSTLTIPTANLTTVTATNATLTNITSTGTSNLSTVTAGSTGVSSLSVTNSATVGSNLTVGVTASVGALNASGDLVAKGGFRQQVGPILVWNSTSVTSAIFANFYYDNVSGHATTWQWTAPYAGSIVAYNFSQIGTGTVNVNVLKNGSTLLTISGLSSAGYVTYTKDTYTFNAGDTITVQYTFSSTGGLAMAGYLTVEC